mgnify:CR=1 FL=1
MKSWYVIVDMMALFLLTIMLNTTYHNTMNKDFQRLQNMQQVLHFLLPSVNQPTTWITTISLLCS